MADRYPSHCPPYERLYIPPDLPILLVFRTPLVTIILIAISIGVPLSDRCALCLDLLASLAAEHLEDRVHTYEARLAEQEMQLHNLSQWQQASQPTSLVSLQNIPDRSNMSVFSNPNPFDRSQEPLSAFSNPLDLEMDLSGPSTSHTDAGPSSAPDRRAYPSI